MNNYYFGDVFVKVTIDLEILADFLSKALGDRTEVAVHNLQDMDKSLYILKNGHVTGRKEGMGLTDLALDMIRPTAQGEQAPYRINYASKTSNGNILRSSTVVFRDEEQKPQFLLCLNHDDSNFHQLIHYLQKVTAIEDHESDENFSEPIGKMGEKIILDIMAENYTPVEKLTSKEKAQLVAKMFYAGVFEIKGSVETAAKILNVSEPTLYRYLKQV